MEWSCAAAVAAEDEAEGVKQVDEAAKECTRNGKGAARRDAQCGETAERAAAQMRKEAPTAEPEAEMGRTAATRAVAQVMETMKIGAEAGRRVEEAEVDEGYAKVMVATGAAPVECQSHQAGPPPATGACPSRRLPPRRSALIPLPVHALHPEVRPCERVSNRRVWSGCGGQALGARASAKLVALRRPCDHCAGARRRASPVSFRGAKQGSTSHSGVPALCLTSYTAQLLHSSGEGTELRGRRRVCARQEPRGQDVERCGRGGGPPSSARGCRAGCHTWY